MRPKPCAALAARTALSAARIGRALGLRYTPEFDFEFDPGLENAARVDALLREARSKE